MTIRFVPLFSGSSGNASFIEAGGSRLLIDAGLPGRTVTQALSACGFAPESINGILVTHEHRDHVAGVGVLARRFRIPVYANAATWESMSPIIGELPPGLVRIFETERDFYIGGLGITPFATPHDAAESVGYRFCASGRVLTLMTDVGHMDSYLIAAAEGSDLVLMESNHDVGMLKTGPYPYPLKMRILSDTGHLSNDAAGAALARLYRAGLKHAVLGHLSKDNNYESLALDTVRARLREEDIPDEEFALTVAHRDRPCGVFDIE